MYLERRFHWCPSIDMEMAEQETETDEGGGERKMEISLTECIVLFWLEKGQLNASMNGWQLAKLSHWLKWSERTR